MTPEYAGFSSLASQASSMDSLSQAARKKQLHIARNILILLGVVKIALNAYFFNAIDAKVNEAVQRQVQQARLQGRAMNPVEIAEATRKAAIIEKIVWGGAGVLGVAFIFLGLCVPKYPVPITVFSLLLYLITTAIFGIINPLSLMEILLFKFFAVAALMKSISAAIAYQRVETASGRDADRFNADIRQPQPIRRTRQTAVETEREPANNISSAALPFHQTAETAATGVEIRSLAPASAVAVVFGVLSVALLLLGALVHNAHWSLFALAPWMLAIGLWFMKPYFFRGELGPTGLLIENPPMLLPYASIENITIAGITREPMRPYMEPGPLALTHADGFVRIPECLNVPAQNLYRELFARIPAGGSRDLPAELDEHLQKEEAAFGVNSVFTYCSRRFAKCGPATGHVQGRFLLMMICGLIWMSVGIASAVLHKDQEFSPWIVIGAVLAGVSFLVFLMERSKQGRPKPLPKKFRDAGLIVSPAGLRLRQGDLSGVLRWDELRQVVYRTAQKSFSVTRMENIVVGLDLVVDGVVIRLADIYDRPLPMIHAVINHFWKSRQANRTPTTNDTAAAVVVKDK